MVLNPLYGSNVNLGSIKYNIHESWEAFFLTNLVLLEETLNQIGDDFTPPREKIFKAFETSRNNIKFVIVGQDPYKQKGHATGRCFERELSDWRSSNPSLKAILSSMFYFEFGSNPKIDEITGKADSSSWSILPPRSIFKHWEESKGVFFLNKALTTKIGTSNAHKNLWLPFIHEVVKYLSKETKSTWLLWGNEAQTLIPFINQNSKIITTIHPAAFSFANGSESDDRLKKFTFNSGIDLILTSKNSSNQEIVVGTSDTIAKYVDPGLHELFQEIQHLEDILLKLENEKLEIEKMISDFNFRFNQELGDLITEILKLKTKLVKDDPAKFQEAQENEKRFKQEFHLERKRNIKELSEDDTKKIKTLRNKAAKICHPDRFQHESDELKERAKIISQQLNEAYKNNDIEKVQQILTTLENGELDFVQIEKEQDKNKLKTKVESLKKSINKLKDELTEIRKNHIYQKVVDISDMDLYFEELRRDLRLELSLLKKKIEHV